MNQLSLTEHLSNIGKIYGIKKVTNIDNRDHEYCLVNGVETYLNKSFIIGAEEIVLGIYDDNELLIASFFHELGHIIKHENNMFNTEEQAWKIGFEVAREHGFTFSIKTHKWAYEQLCTYNKSR